MVAHRSTHSIFEPHVCLWASSKARAPLRHWPYPSHVVRGTSLYICSTAKNTCAHSCPCLHPTNRPFSKTMRHSHDAPRTTKALRHPRLHTDHARTAKKYTFMGRRDKKLTLAYQFWPTQNGTNPTTDKNCSLRMTKNCQPMPQKSACHAFLCTASHFHAANTPLANWHSACI